MHDDAMISHMETVMDDGQRIKRRASVSAISTAGPATLVDPLKKMIIIHGCAKRRNHPPY
jgi:hypothetical protein